MTDEVGVGSDLSTGSDKDPTSPPVTVGLCFTSLATPASPTSRGTVGTSISTNRGGVAPDHPTPGPLGLTVTPSLRPLASLTSV